MQVKDDTLPAAHAVVSFALKRPNAPRDDHSPSPLPLPPAREEDIQRAREKRAVVGGADGTGQAGALAMTTGRKKREPVQRSRKEEMEAYGRAFEGCGKQSDYDKGLGRHVWVRAICGVVGRHADPGSSRSCYPVKSTKRFNLYRKRRGSETHPHAQRERRHACDCSSRNQDSQVHEASEHRGYRRYVCGSEWVLVPLLSTSILMGLACHR